MTAELSGCNTDHLARKACSIFYLILYRKYLLTSALGQVFSNFSVYQNNSGGLVNTQIVGPTPVISDSEGLRWVLRICISSKFQVPLLLLVGIHTLRIPFLDVKNGL